MERSKRLWSRCADDMHKNMLSTDEKNCTIEEHYKNQNDKVDAHSFTESLQVIGKMQRRGHCHASVMVMEFFYFNLLRSIFIINELRLEPKCIKRLS